MKIAEIDAYCDLFEQHLNRGEAVSVERFLTHERLSANDQLIAELQEVVRDYHLRRQALAVANQSLESDDDNLHTEMVIATPINRIIGDYKLLQQLGEGGMGMVHMAEQTVRRLLEKVKAERMERFDNAKAEPGKAVRR